MCLSLTITTNDLNRVVPIFDQTPRLDEKTKKDVVLKTRAPRSLLLINNACATLCICAFFCLLTNKQSPSNSFSGIMTTGIMNDNIISSFKLGNMLLFIFHKLGSVSILNITD